MANAKDICLWLDDRWYDALQKHLKNGTVEDKLNEYLDELINQLPEREYDRISREIQEEAKREQAAREAARVFTAFRIREFGDTKLFKVDGDTDLLSVGNALRSYMCREDQDGFAKKRLPWHDGDQSGGIRTPGAGAAGECRQGRSSL